MALMSTRSWDDWIREYGKSHSHPVNRRCHMIGIPMIARFLFVGLRWWAAKVSGPRSGG
jgi:hypothetical protein